MAGKVTVKTEITDVEEQLSRKAKTYDGRNCLVPIPLEHANKDVIILIKKRKRK